MLCSDAASQHQSLPKLGARTIVVLESLCAGLEHTPVNSGLLSTVCRAYADHRVYFFAERQHQVEVLDKVGSFPNLETYSIEIPRRKLREWPRLFHEFLMILKIRRRLDWNSVWILMVTSTVPSTLYALCLAKMTGLFRGVGIQAVLHGNLVEIRGWRSRNPLLRAVDLRSAMFLCRRPNIRFIVLEASIRNQLLREMPRLDGHVDVLPHPISPGEGRGGHLSSDPGRPLKIGFVGLAGREKGFDLFLRVAAQVKERCGGEVQFVAVGRLHPDFGGCNLTVLDNRITTERLSRSALVAGISELDFICTPYRESHYGLSASGVLLDAIAWQVPLISTRFPLMEELFHEYGDIGYLCESEADLVENIVSILREFDRDRYRRQVAALAQVRAARTPVALAGVYRSITEKLIP